MKRFLFASLAALAIAGTTSAQTSDDTRPMWGVRAAIDMNLPGKWHAGSNKVKMYSNGLGATVGAVCNVYLGHNFYLEPGVSLFYDTYRYDDMVFSLGDGMVGEEDPSLYKVGFRVPVVAGYTFVFGNGGKLSVYTGPELSYAFAGEIKFKNKELADDPMLGLFNGQRRVDCAWKIGVGMPFGSWMIALDGAIGMTDLFKHDVSFRENRLSLSATYYF